MGFLIDGIYPPGQQQRQRPRWVTDAAATLAMRKRTYGTTHAVTRLIGPKAAAAGLERTGGRGGGVVFSATLWHVKHETKDF